MRVHVTKTFADRIEDRPKSTYQTPPGRARQDAHQVSSPRPEDLLRLQGTVGNQAVLRLLRQASPGVALSTSEATIQRKLPKNKDFLKSARTRGVDDPTVLNADKGQQALIEERKRNGLPAHNVIFTKKGSLGGRHADILTAYEDFDQNRSIESLSKLFDTITYWEALNAGSAKEPWFPNAIQLLNWLKQEIRNEIQDHTERAFASKKNLTKELANLSTATAIRENKDKKWQDEMPPWMSALGVAPGYYGKHLANYPKRKAGLNQFYDSLRDGDLKAAEKTYNDELDKVPGMYLIKPLIIGRFAGAVGLQNLVGTQSQAPGPLTEDEKKAITQYSALEFGGMNAQLRSTLKRPDASKPPPVDKTMYMEFVVSGMNKLPPFKGIAYRCFLTEPGGYFDVMQPGATIVDLAFQSASPSLNGVEHYLRAYFGHKHIYVMIHSRSAVNIMSLAADPREGEVLFKPGVRLKVRAVWHHIGDRVPPNAPPEAQMILHKWGQFKGSDGVEGHTEETAQKLDPTKQKAVEWRQVKVIELDEL